MQQFIFQLYQIPKRTLYNATTPYINILDVTGKWGRCETYGTFYVTSHTNKLTSYPVAAYKLFQEIRFLRQERAKEEEEKEGGEEGKGK